MDDISLIYLNGNTEETSFYDETYTYSYDKYSCVRGFYFAHIVFNWFVFLSGIACMATRVWSRTLFLHAWFGRIYILSMFWSTATSLLMNNTGLPLATLISFACVLGGLTLGWIVIVVYRQNMNKAATALVQEQLVERLDNKPTESDATTKEREATSVNLNEMHQQALATINDNKTFWQRYLSLKTLHAVLFFASWFQIAGRMFASNQSGDFTCHTYPVYKPIDTPEGDYADKNLTMVPPHDPNWDRLPWANNVVGWSLGLIFGSMGIALVVGAIWNYILVRQAAKRRAASEVVEDSDLTMSKSLPDATEVFSGPISDDSEESDEASD